MENFEENNGQETNAEPQPSSEEESDKLMPETEELMEWQEKGWKTPEKEEAPGAKAELEGREYLGEELDLYKNAAPEIKQDIRSSIDEAYQIENEINKAMRNGEGQELSHEEILKIANTTEPEVVADVSEQLSNNEGLSDEDFARFHESVYPEAPRTDVAYEETINNEGETSEPEPEYRQRSAEEIGAERLEKWTNAAKGFFRKGAAILAPMVLAKNGYRAVKESAVSGGENMRLLMNEKVESFATAGKIWRFRNEMESLTREQGPAIEKMQQGYDLIEKIRTMSPEAQERKEFKALHREAERMVDEGQNEVNKLQGKLEQSKALWMEFLAQDTNMSVAIRGIKARKAAKKDRRGARA